MSKSHATLTENVPQYPHRSIVGLVFEVARHLAITIDRRVAPFNVTGQQAALLVRSSKEPRLTPTQLAPWLGTDNAGITRLVDRLEAKGLVARQASPSDRRAVVIEPTAAGQELVPHLVAALDEVTAGLVEGFTSEELVLAESSLRHLLGNIARCESECFPAEHTSRRAQTEESLTGGMEG